MRLGFRETGGSVRIVKRFLAFLVVPATLLLGLYCLGLGVLGWIDGGDMNLPLVPVAPESLATALALAGAFAILAAFLSVRPGRWFRLPLLIWWVVMVVVLVSTVFRASYRFNGLADLESHGWLLLGALVLLCGAWRRFRPPGRGQAGMRRSY